MKNYFFKAFTALILAGTVLSSFTTKEVEPINSNYPLKTSFKLPKLNIEYLQSDKDLKKSDLKVNFTTIPSIKDGKVVGRYYDYGTENPIYIDFTNYTHYITVYDVNDSNKKVTLKTIYDNDLDAYVVSEDAPEFWCEAACTVTSLAIMASDGPSPLMDVLGFAYQAACVGDCVTKRR